MSQYLVLIYESEQAYAEGGEDTWNAVMQGHEAFGEKHAATLKGGNALDPTTAARSVRPDGSGGYTVTDGPFLETKEALGGYYVIEADGIEQAVEIAKDVPFSYGGVEVRPIMVFS